MVAAFGALLGLTSSDLVLLREGTVRGARHTNPAEILGASELTGQRAARASAAEARDLLRRVPAVRDAAVELNLSGSYVVQLSERQAVGRWVAGGVEWFVDSEGVLFSSLDETAAPALLVIDQSVDQRLPGERLDPALVEAAFRLAALAPGELRPDMVAPRVRLDPAPTGLVVESGGSWEIRFGGPEAFDEKLSVVRQFMRNQPDRPLDYVDVRSPERIVFSPR